MYKLKTRGLRTLPWGTPFVQRKGGGGRRGTAIHRWGRWRTTTGRFHPILNCAATEAADHGEHHDCKMPCSGLGTPLLDTFWHPGPGTSRHLLSTVRRSEHDLPSLTFSVSSAELLLDRNWTFDEIKLFGQAKRIYHWKPHEKFSCKIGINCQLRQDPPPWGYFSHLWS